ncbi:hypothetical protein WDU94_007574 [Cyamophila willieti]
MSRKDFLSLSRSGQYKRRKSLQDPPAILRTTPRQFLSPGSPVILRTTPSQRFNRSNNQSALVIEDSPFVLRTSPRRRVDNTVDNNTNTQQAFEAQLAGDFNVMASGVNLDILRAINRTEEKVDRMWEILMRLYPIQTLPLQKFENIQVFDQHEKALLDANKTTSVELALASVGGSPGRVYAFNCLKACLTDGLATQFSLSGKLCAGPGSGQSPKRRFADSRLYKLITKAVRNKFPQEKEQDIRSAVSDWLSQSKHRIARKKRIETTSLIQH